MKNVWFVSDHHFHHKNILGFKRPDGSPLRDFSSVEEMNETMIERHNEVVRDGDRVYFLGDVTFEYGPPLDYIMKKLRGSKRLIVGNHDVLKTEGLEQHFKKVQLWRMFPEHGFICSHVPVHSSVLERRGRTMLNVHGHVHVNTVLSTDPETWAEPDWRYFNVCVEEVDYRPVHIDVVIEKARQLQEAS